MELTALKYHGLISRHFPRGEDYGQLADSYRRLGFGKESIEATEQAIALCPDDIDQWNNRASILYYSAKFEEAIDLSPRESRIWSTLGSALYRNGRHEEAIEKVKKAISLNPTDASAWWYWATCLCALDQPVEANRIVQLARKYEPDDKDLADLQEQLSEYPATHLPELKLQDALKL